MTKETYVSEKELLSLLQPFVNQTIKTNELIKQISKLKNVEVVTVSTEDYFEAKVVTFNGDKYGTDCDKQV